jgi:hypothetical protein
MKKSLDERIDDHNRYRIPQSEEKEKEQEDRELPVVQPSTQPKMKEEEEGRKGE